MKPALRSIATALILSLTSPAGAVDLVVNRNTPVKNLSLNMVRAIFGMRLTSWPDGMPIHVFVLGDKTSLHSDFSKQILGVFPHQLRRAWNRQIYAGIGQAPARLESEKEMREKVAETPGAIGYISEEMLNEQIRKVAVE